VTSQIQMSRSRRVGHGELVPSSDTRRILVLLGLAAMGCSRLPGTTRARANHRTGSARPERQRASSEIAKWPVPCRDGGSWTPRTTARARSACAAYRMACENTRRDVHEHIMGSNCAFMPPVARTVGGPPLMAAVIFPSSLIATPLQSVTQARAVVDQFGCSGRPLLVEVMSTRGVPPDRPRPGWSRRMAYWPNTMRPSPAARSRVAVCKA